MDKAMEHARNVEQALLSAGIDLLIPAPARDVINDAVASALGVDQSTRDTSCIWEWVEAGARQGIVDALRHQDVTDLPELASLTG
jgi:hypothetical protein